MISQTNEQALENCIKRALVEASCYEKGNPVECDRKFAILKTLIHRCICDF